MASLKSVFLLQRAGCLFAILMVTCSLPKADSSNVGYIPFVDGRTYYKLHTTRLTWEEAKSACENEGARLAMIDTLEKVRFVNDMRAACQWVWTGISRAGFGSPWYSVGHESRGEELTHLPWSPIRILGIIPGSNCVAIMGFGMVFNVGLANYNCFFHKSFVCEKHVQPQTVNVQVTNEQRLNEQRLNEQRLNEQRLREQLANEQRLREQGLREQLANEQKLREQLANEQRLREQGLREQLANEQKLREQLANEQRLREQGLREQLANEQRLREQILNAQRLNEPKTGVQQQSGQLQFEDQVQATK